ncbi:hypothetical protein Trydic_g18209 [Trypoxylus dichotomus]
MFRNLSIFIVLCTIWMVYTDSDDIVVKIVDVYNMSDPMTRDAQKLLKKAVTLFNTSNEITKYVSLYFRSSYPNNFWQTFRTGEGYYICYTHKTQLMLTKGYVNETYLMFAASNECK